MTIISHIAVSSHFTSHLSLFTYLSSFGEGASLALEHTQTRARAQARARTQKPLTTTRVYLSLLTNFLATYKVLLNA